MGEKPEKRPRGARVGKRGDPDIQAAGTLSVASLDKLVADPLVLRGIEVEILAFNLTLRTRNRFDFSKTDMVGLQEDDEVTGIDGGLRGRELLNIVCRLEMAALRPGQHIFAKDTKVFFQVFVDEKNLVTNNAYVAREGVVSQELLQLYVTALLFRFCSQPFKDCSCVIRFACSATHLRRLFSSFKGAAPSRSDTSHGSTKSQAPLRLLKQFSLPLPCDAGPVNGSRAFGAG
jgi:hypothetical protein